MHNKLIFVIMLILVLSFNVSPASAEPGKDALSLLEAVKATLKKQPSILIQKQEVEANKGSLQEERGKFDLTLDTSLKNALDQQYVVDTSANTYKEKQNITDYTLGIKKQLRSGIVLNPNVQMTRTDDRVTGLPTTNEASVNFTLTLPLFKGRGADTVAAEETAAALNLEASELDLRHTTSLSVLRTVTSYWRYVGAKEKLQVLEEAESWAKQVVEELKKLIDADERPKADLDQARANQEEKTVRRIEAQQALTEARYVLALAMGLSSEEIGGVPWPSDHFPQPSRKRQLLPTRDYITMAKQRRYDIMASRIREDSSKTLLIAARRDLEPQLNVTLNVGYNGLETGNTISKPFDSLYGNVPGMVCSAGITFQYPLHNNVAMGVLLQRQSEYTRTAIETSNLVRNIHSNVIIANQAVRRAMIALRNTRYSTASYGKAVKNETLKLRLGMSTVIDLLNMKDRLINAALTEIGARLTYANAVVRLRFETGALFAESGDMLSLDMEQLTTVPSY